MEIRGATEVDIRNALDKANADYDGNLQIDYANPLNQRGDAYRVKFRVESSRGPGARMSHSGRRIPAMCWHGFRDVFLALFETNPDARIKTAMATYNGLAGFEEVYGSTYHRNAGSMMYPVEFGSLCECSDYIHADGS